MRVYKCGSNGCGKGLITDLNEWGPCPKCGGMSWNKLRLATYCTMLRIWWISGRQLIVPPEGSWLEKFLKKHMKDEKETGTVATGQGGL